MNVKTVGDLKLNLKLQRSEIKAKRQERNVNSGVGYVGLFL